MRFLLCAFACALLAPAAAAYPNHAYPCDVDGADGVCFGEYEGGSCENGSYDAVTGVAVKSGGHYLADVDGFALCDGSESGRREVWGVAVETPYVTLAWAHEECEGDTYCDVEGDSVWFWVLRNHGRLDAPLPPPNPGWGRLLP